MAASVSFSKIWKVVSDARAGQHHVPRLCVVGAAGELGRVVEVLSAGAADERGGVSAALDALTPADFPREDRLLADWDFVVFVAAGCEAAEAAPLVAAVRKAGKHVLALVDEGADLDWPKLAGVVPGEVCRGLGRHPSGTPTLEGRIVHVTGHGAGTLVHRFPALRRAYCDHVILTNAKQNGVIGAVFLIPGADMPAMTANQIRMVLHIAAAYGEDVGLDRALEILSVVSTGFVFRALARQALDFVPGFGWAFKAGIGFSGTVALGQAAVAYFEAGAPLRTSRMQRINRAIEQGKSRVPKLLLRGVGAG